MSIIPDYPEGVELSIAHREKLHPMFQKLSHGISEFSFANLYLFRKEHAYHLSRVQKDILVIFGNDTGEPFFMCPFELPEFEALNALFDRHQTMKCATPEQAEILGSKGFKVIEDRDNFDYLYKRESLSGLSGRKYSKKRNLIKAFVKNHTYEGKPLLEEYLPHALAVLDKWREGRDDDGDYGPAREALEKSEVLQLCGGIYYVEDQPVAYSLGEELARGNSFVIHFEKALLGYKGIYQFVNQAFASIITENYEFINREQDLGEEGLRQAKMSYKPVGFVKKFKITKEKDHG